MSEDQVKMVEEVTRDQSKSKVWFQQRTGRVTASRLKSELCTFLANPSQSIIKSICYPESSKFYSAACTWGCNHEGPAVKHIIIIFIGKVDCRIEYFCLTAQNIFA